MQFSNTIKKIFFFVMFGISCEVFFSAMYDFFFMIYSNLEINYRLLGYTYLWMIPIYALIPIIANWLKPFLSNLSIAKQVILGVVIIYFIEFSAGFLIEKIVGRCPWQYTEGWHIMGYIRIDYIFFWAFFAWIILRLNAYLDTILSKNN